MTGRRKKKREREIETTETEETLIERALDDLNRVERPIGFPLSPQLLAAADAENRVKRRAILELLVTDIHLIMDR